MPVISYSSMSYAKYAGIGLREVCVAATFSLPRSEFEEIAWAPQYRAVETSGRTIGRAPAPFAAPASSAEGAAALAPACVC